MKGARNGGGDGFARFAAGGALAAFFLLLAARGGKVFPAALAGDALVLALAGLLLWKRAGVFEGNRSLLLLLVLLALLQLLSVPGSSCPEGAFLSLSRFWAAVGFAFLAREAWSPGDRRLFEGVFLGVAAAQSILFAVFRFSGAAAPFLLLPGNPQYAALWICAAALGAAVRPGWSVRARAFWGSFLGAGVFLSSTRSAEAGLTAGALYLLSRRWGWRGAAAAAAALSGLFILLPDSWVEPIVRAQSPFAWKRWDIWSSAWEGILQKPWLGWGPGQFETLYRLHMRPQDLLPVRFDHATLFAHNDYLQAAAAWGFPALVVLTGVLAALVRSVPAAARERRAVLAAGAVFSLFNFPFALPVNAFVGGAAAGFPSASGRRGPPARWGVRALAVFMGSLALFLCTRLPSSFEPGPPDRVFYGRSSVLLSRGEAALSSPDGGAEAEALFRRSLRLFPGRAEAWRGLAQVLGKRDPAGAEAALRRALELHPRNAVWWLDLALLQEERGEAEEAARSAHRALGTEPRFAAAAFELGRLIRSRGEPAKARRWLEALAARGPVAADAGTLSPYAKAVLAWDADALRREIDRCRTDGKDIIHALR